VRRHVSRLTQVRVTRLTAFLLTAFVLAALARVALQFIGHDLGFDEAYILQAVDSLVGTRRYASFGAARGFGPWDFDPNLTTGPTLTLLLVPIWWITSGSLVAIRLVMLAIFVTYCGGVFVLTRGLSFRWAATGLLLTPAILVAPAYLGGALGELPGSALFVWAFVAVRSGRFRLAACLVGLTVQAKLAFLTMAVGVLFPIFWSLRRSRIATRSEILRLIGVALLPSMLFESWRFASLGGWSGYLNSIDELRAYVAEQNMDLFGGWTAGGRHLLKWNNFVALFPTPLWLLIIVSALLCLSELMCRLVGKRGNLPFLPFDYELIGAVVSGLVMFLGWWTQSVQDSPRQALAVVLVSVHSLLLFAARSVRTWSRPVRFYLSLPIAFLGLLAVTSAFGGPWKADVNPVSRSHQEIATLIREEKATSLLARGWFQFPELQLLARIPAVQWIEPDGQVAILDGELLYGGGVSEREFLASCDEVLLRVDWTVVCRPRVPDYAALRDVSVVTWGEQESRLGQTSNEQPNGFGGLWIMIEPEDPTALLALQVLIDGSQIEVGEISSDGSVITAFVPPSVYRTPGRHVIKLRNAITGQVIPVGEFTL
jgi:hypothetical protein